MNRVLVTGAAGFLGRRVVRLLRETPARVIGADYAASDGIVACDLVDRAAVAALIHEHRPDVVVHCAAIVPRSASGYDDTAAATANFQMVAHLARSAPRIVFTSSMTVYPDDVEVAREEDAGPSGAGYGAMKFAAENELLRHQNLDVVVLRLPGLFGEPRRSGVLFNASVAFARGLEFSPVEPAPRWSAIHADDAATMVARATALPAGKHVLNIGYEGPMAVADAVDRIAAYFNRPPLGRPRRWFTFDLSRSTPLLGRPASTFDERLSTLCQWALSDSGDSANASPS